MPSYVDPHTSFFDKAFDSSSLIGYDLLLLIGAHGLDYTIYQASSNKFIGLESFKFVGLKSDDQLAAEFQSVLGERKWLNGSFHQVDIIISSAACTLIPSALFEKKEKSLYMDFNRPVEEGFSLEYNTIRNADAVNLFSLPTNLIETIQSKWKQASFFHASSVFIESLMINYKNKARENMLFVNVFQDFFEVASLKTGKLFFHNTFQYRSKEDFIYFLLTVIEQLKLNPEEVELVLSGNIDKNSIYYDMVYQYIRNSRFIERNDTFRYSYVFDRITYHKFYTLFNCLQCAS